MSRFIELIKRLARGRRQVIELRTIALGFPAIRRRLQSDASWPRSALSAFDADPSLWLYLYTLGRLERVETEREILAAMVEIEQRTQTENLAAALKQAGMTQADFAASFALGGPRP